MTGHLGGVAARLLHCALHGTEAIELACEDALNGLCWQENLEVLLGGSHFIATAHHSMLV